MSSTKSKRLLLIDGDLILYQTLAATETEREIEPEMWALTNDLAEFKTNINQQLLRIRDDLGGKIVVCLSDNENFRKDIYPDYKANRKNNRKPVGFKAAKAWMTKEWSAIIKPRLEADDVMGILSTKPGNTDAVIVSMDKDMRTIPGKLYRYRDGAKIVVTEAEADRYHLLQTLTGDTTDNYPGCPGIGPVKAEAILNKPGDPWNNVVQQFRSSGLTEGDALVQARLARILRWSDWDNAKQLPRLWTPASPSDRPVLESATGG